MSQNHDEIGSISSSDSPSKKQADEFLSTASLYQLGHLPTETPNPKTENLSELVKTNLTLAVETLKQVDLSALSILNSRIESITNLVSDMLTTLRQGGRIFFCGCGATGRLSLINEFLWISLFPEAREKVVGFMAGGDIALVHALEGFEDFPDFGARHLRELGFGKQDLLVCSTEGGETPYVIGAVEEGVRIGAQAPWFLFCNPEKLLVDTVARSRRVIENPKIRKMDLSVGPMALTGSTRMQASTVLQWVTGFSMELAGEMHFHRKEKNIGESVRQNLSALMTTYTDLNLSRLSEFVSQESSIYLSGGFVNYWSRDFGMTVFTDTTERAPTFSLIPFQPRQSLEDLESNKLRSLSHIFIEGAKDSAESWEILFGRKPRCLEWADVSPRTSVSYLQNFDFSQSFEEERGKGVQVESFRISKQGNELIWVLQNLQWPISVGELSLLNQHVLLKMLLNIHSTLVMGKLGRYEKNLMTWVMPNNGKLIDRATRYLLILLKDRGGNFTYAQVVTQLFCEKAKMKPGESVIHRVLQAFGFSTQ